ncbi:MAG: glycosyltransferase [Planctomycetota bacterium]
MRVGLDYLPAATHFPGVGRYARELVRAVERLDAPPELTLIELGRPERIVPEASLGLTDRPGLRRVVGRLPQRAIDFGERLGFGPERRLGPVDVFQRTRPGWPAIRRAPVVRAVSELPPPGHPSEGAVRAALDRDDAWIVFSAEGEATLVERFGRPAERVHRTPVGCDHWMRDLDADPGPADPPYLLVLGALRTERHPDLVLDAFDKARQSRRDLELVFCGGTGDAAELLQRRLRFASGRSSVRQVAPVEAELPELVARASALVHLTEGELTAVTPLEALAAGTPVVVSDIPAFREALGDEAWYVVTPPSLRHRKALPEQLLAAVDSAQDAGARGGRRRLAANYPWSGCAAATMKVWETVAEGTAAR